MFHINQLLLSPGNVDNGYVLYVPLVGIKLHNMDVQYYSSIPDLLNDMVHLYLVLLHSHLMVYQMECLPRFGLHEPSHPGILFHL